MRRDICVRYAEFLSPTVIAWSFESQIVTLKLHRKSANMIHSPPFPHHFTLSIALANDIRAVAIQVNLGIGYLN